MKISPRIKAEFDFLTSQSAPAIGNAADIPFDPNGFSALHCWAAYDTYGQLLPCSEPSLFNKALQQKQAINLQVKMWAEGVHDFTLHPTELLDYTRGWPDWVYKAVLQQAANLFRHSIGFVPSFVAFSK